jgi:hypothetical protein
MAQNSMQIFATGNVIAFGAASASVAIPNTLSGTKPKYVRLVSTGACYVKLGAAGVTAAAGDLMVQPADSVVVAVSGCTNIAALQQSAGGTLQISPLEDN